MGEQLTCAERVSGSLESSMEDIRKLWEAYTEGDEDKYTDEIGNIYEYGLAFDYVAPGTFKDQEHGYFRWQLSYGGPSTEFRFYVGRDFKPYKIQYWFLDWWDGAFKYLDRDDNRLMEEIFESLFVESGAAESEYAESTE